MSQPGDQSRPLPLRNPDGSWRHTNALAAQTSPYLLQHAHNPVDWHPWGPEAFEQARRLDRPIFLSVGYSTCYWCHVMERQCFEDPAIAAVMNAHFINIKVDREERPDVDDLYMAAVQLMTGHGGWPMSVFLTPPTDPQRPAAEGGLLPFYAGTYFPPTPSPHMPGFPQLLEALAAAWRERRDQVLQQARHTAGELHAHQQRLPDPSPLSVGLVQSAANQLARMHDPEHGGFGDAPKFPQASNLQLLLKVHRNRPNADLWHALTHTLDRMARGGIFDQVAGGFHRYSTDREWLVPHFEKMLYDHGQLVEVYLDAAGIGAHPGDATLFARVVHDTCDYVLREMTDASGAFWSAQDAEAQAREGANYVWTAAQFDEAMKPHAGELAMARALYGMDQGPNFRDPHQPGPTTLNVLYQPVALDEFARGHGMALEQAVAWKGRIDAVLRRARSQRPRPATDDKVLAAWNGMMIAALARAGRELDEPRYIAAAGRAARAILDHMRDARGRLLRSMRHGKAHIAAFLEDYAFLMHGLLELHRSAPEQGWRDAAETLERVSREEFGAAEPEAGYYDVPADHGDLLLRSRSIYDGAIPSGNSQMTHNLIDLFEITGREEYLARAAASLRFFAGSMRAMGANMAHMHHALLRAMELDPSLDEANAAAASRGAEKEPVRTWVEPATVAVREGTAEFRVNLDILPGYHLHAPDGEEEGVAVVNVRVEPAEAWEATVEYPPGTRRRYPMADGPVSVYEGVVTLGVSLRRRAGATEGRPEAVVLRYQACTERACLESREAPLAVVWDVARGGGGVA